MWANLIPSNQRTVPMNAPQVACDPSERDPREFPIGIYSTDSYRFGGAMVFLWFEDNTQAIRHLCDDLPSLYLDEDEMDDEDGTFGQLRTMLATVEQLKDIDLDAMNQLLSYYCTVRWAGSFDDLRTGNNEFAKEVQAEFYSNEYGDERGMTEDAYDDWVAHLENYIG